MSVSQLATYQSCLLKVINSIPQTLILLKLCVCVFVHVCVFFLYQSFKSWDKLKDSRNQALLPSLSMTIQSVWLLLLLLLLFYSGCYCCYGYYYYYFTSRWKLAGKVGIGRIEFFLLVGEVLPRILLIISNQVNHCDLSTVKDMWVIVRTLGFIASWLTKVFSKLSQGNLLFGRDQIFSQTLKHCGVFKLLLAN